MNPNVIAKPQDALFPGGIDAQCQRFSNIVTEIKNKYKNIIEEDFQVDIKDIGVHSWRKCAHTKLNTGSTAGPSGTAACIRGGHSMGKNRDVYIVHEKASDTYCGRILQGLPEHSPEFAVSYPDFVPLDLKQSLEDGIHEAELAERQKEIDAKVNDALNSIFGIEILAAFPTIRKLLRIGLASHLIHYDSLSKPVYQADPRPILPANSALHRTAIFTNPRVLELKQYVSIAMPWEGHYKYFAPASGLPPHVMIYAYIKSLDMKIQNIPQKIEELLDRRNMMGALSLDQIARAVENGPRISAMINDIATMKRRMENNINITVQAGASEGAGRAIVRRARPHYQYKHPDGKERHVPVGWTFPLVGLKLMYQQWHYGDEAGKVPPIKELQTSDVSHLQRGRTTFYECKNLMKVIDEAAEKAGFPVSRGFMELVECNTCYFHGEGAILEHVAAKTPKGRDREIWAMKWSSVLREFYKRKKNTEASTS